LSHDYAIDKQNKVRQLRDKAAYDKETVHAILDAGILAHVAFVQDGQPVVVPMLYGRRDETVFLHGAKKSRIIRLLEGTGTACMNVTLVDGLVYARSAFNSSMNYRSVTLFGSARLIDGDAEKRAALRVITECTMPGRWDELREPLEKEVRMTGVIALDIESASAKVSTGMPVDEDEDYSIPVWAGVLPLRAQFTNLQTDERVLDGVEASDVVLAMEGKVL
jgi:nitroimidazol reductase NimA-like FMN-containing flavoprotein (pyridoxamine 5'-phosphate oxidase superfamily)